MLHSVTDDRSLYFTAAELRVLVLLNWGQFIELEDRAADDDDNVPQQKVDSFRVALSLLSDLSL